MIKSVVWECDKCKKTQMVPVDNDSFEIDLRLGTKDSSKLETLTIKAVAKLRCYNCEKISFETLFDSGEEVKK